MLFVRLLRNADGGWANLAFSQLALQAGVSRETFFTQELIAVLSRASIEGVVVPMDGSLLGLGVAHDVSLLDRRR